MDAGNYIVFLIIFFVVVSILFILNIFAKAYIWGNLLNKMKNNSGNFDTTKILMIVAIVIALYLLIIKMFGANPTIRASLTQSQ